MGQVRLHMADLLKEGAGLRDVWYPVQPCKASHPHAHARARPAHAEAYAYVHDAHALHMHMHMLCICERMQMRMTYMRTGRVRREWRPPAADRGASSSHRRGAMC